MPEESDHLRVPRTADEEAALLRERPDAWEYLLYAGTLLMGRNSHEQEYRDHLLRYAPLSGEPLGDQEAIIRLQAAFPDALSMADTLMRLFDADVQEQAFGAPGEPGDEALIRQLAERIIDGYHQFLVWGRDLRSARVPADFQDAFGLAADMMRQPIEEVRAFVDDVVREMDQLPDLLDSDDDDPIEITVELVVSVGDDASEAFHEELDRLKRSGYSA